MGIDVRAEYPLGCARDNLRGGGAHGNFLGALFPVPLLWQGYNYE
jgi:hypothetical protein